MTNFYELTTWLIHLMPAKWDEMHNNEERNEVFIFVPERNFLGEAGFEDIREVCVKRACLPADFVVLHASGQECPLPTELANRVFASLRDARADTARDSSLVPGCIHSSHGCRRNAAGRGRFRQKVFQFLSASSPVLDAIA